MIKLPLKCNRIHVSTLCDWVSQFIFYICGCLLVENEWNRLTSLISIGYHAGWVVRLTRTKLNTPKPFARRAYGNISMVYLDILVSDGLNIFSVKNPRNNQRNVCELYRTRKVNRINFISSSPETYIIWNGTRWLVKANSGDLDNTYKNHNIGLCMNPKLISNHRLHFSKIHSQTITTTAWPAATLLCWE
jgi:hypothetical protein